MVLSTILGPSSSQGLRALNGSLSSGLDRPRQIQQASASRRLLQGYRATLWATLIIMIDATPCDSGTIEHLDRSAHGWAGGEYAVEHWFSAGNLAPSSAPDPLLAKYRNVSPPTPPTQMHRSFQHIYSTGVSQRSMMPILHICLV